MTPHATSKSKLRQLTQATSRQIQSAQIIPSFDCLVASLVLSSISCHATSVTAILNTPSTLDITVIDNGAAVHSDVWPQICTEPIDCHPRATVLHAAATVSHLTLTSSSAVTHQRKSVHCAQPIADTPLAAASSRLHPHRGGVIVEIRRLFDNIPVRRQAALQLSEPRRQDAVRRRIVAIALCNPSVAIRVLLPNKQTLFQSHAGSSLTPAALSKTLGLRSNPKWRPIEGRHETNSELSLFGFIAPHSLTRLSDDAQIVAVNGVPLHRTARVHSLVRNSIRQSLSRNNRNHLGNTESVAEIRKDAPSNSHPHAAYVLNVSCARVDISVSSYEFGALIVGYAKIDVEKFVAEHVTRTCRQNHRAQATSDRKNDDDEPNEKSAFKAGFEEFCIRTSGNARKRSLPVNDARYAFLSSNAKKPRPVDRSKTPTTAAPPVRRPLSASELRRQRDSDDVRPLSSHSKVQRPKSAHTILSGIAKTVPNWSNPCYRFPGRSPRAIVMSRAGRRGGIEQLSMNEVRVERERLSGMRVIGQVDHKFIILVDEGGTMYALDQHAASERAHFERLLRNVGHRIRSVKVRRGGMKVPLSAAHYSGLKQFKSEIERWGWRVQANENARSTWVIVTEVPELEGTNVRLDSPLQLRQYIDSLCHGASAQCTPIPLVRALATVACHTAVRFGDKLTHDQCAALVDGLVRCDAPFQCAHGRPSIVPLAILKGREEQPRRI